MEPVSFRATDIINLFMIDKLVMFFSHALRSSTLPSIPEQHDHYELYYIAKGYLTLLADREEITIQEGQCLLLAPYTLHQQLAREDVTVLKFAGFLCHGTLPQSLCRKPFRLSEDECSLLCDLMDDGSQ